MITKLRTATGFMDFLPLAVFHGKMTHNRMEAVNRKLTLIEEQEARVRRDKERQTELQRLYRLNPQAALEAQAQALAQQQSYYHDSRYTYFY
jgi:hypothetical protein